MRLSIPLVFYALGCFGTVFGRPISSDNGLSVQVGRDLGTQGDELQPREVVVDHHSRELFDEPSVLEARAQKKKKISAEAQKQRKQQKAAQANVHGKANKPVSPTKQAKGMKKQNAKNNVRKKQNATKNQQKGYTTAAQQQIANKKNAATNGWPSRNQKITNGPPGSGQTVTGKDVRKAVFESNRHSAAGTSAQSFTNNFPARFGNYPNKQTSGRNPQLDYAGTVVPPPPSHGRGRPNPPRPLNMAGSGGEFPIKSSPQGYTKGRPGAMRAVTQNGDYKGVISHDPTRGRNGPNSGDHFKVNINQPNQDIVPEILEDSKGIRP